jgi:mycothiol system anti-sigma-R factor
VSENARNPVSALEPLLDRIEELDEVRGGRDETGTNYRHAQYARHILADVSPLVVAIHGLGGTGKSALLLGLSDCPHVVPLTVAPEASPPDETVPGGCRDLIGVLDEVAAAALIVRSSLGTPAASRIRRGTSPAHIAEILRRRDRLQSGASSEPPSADDTGTTQFPAGQDYALDDRDAVTGAAFESRDSMTCADARALVDNYMDRELPAEEWAKVRQHLETCSSCLREYGLWSAVSRLVQKHCGCDPAPADLRAKVMARIQMIAEASQPRP